MKKAVKIAVPVVAIAVVVVVVLGYYGYLPFFNSPHYGFPSSQQMSNSAGNGHAYNQSGSPQQTSGNPPETSNNVAGVSSYEMLNYTNSVSGSYIIVVEVQFSSSSSAQSEYVLISGSLNILGHLGWTVSGNASYRGFTYMDYSYAGTEGAAGYDGSYMFVIAGYSGSAGSISMSATSQAIVDAMY